MSQIPYPYINGVYSSHASVEISVNNLVIGGITEINYKPSLKKSKVKGAGAQPIGVTEGEADYEGDFSILELQWYLLLENLGDGYGRVPFDIVITKSPVGDSDAFATSVDTLVGCRIDEAAASDKASSADALEKKLKLTIMRIYENGKNIYGQEVSPDI